MGVGRSPSVSARDSQQLVHLLNRLTSPLVIFDDEGNVLFANREAQGRILAGGATADAASGWARYRVSIPAVGRELDTLIDRPERGQVVRKLRPTATGRTYRAVFERVTPGSARLSGAILACFHDVTGQRWAE